MISLLLIPLFFAFVLIVWLDTNAAGEYGELFGVGKYLYPRYFYQRAQGNPLSVIDFLNQDQHTFFKRLIVCPVCLSTWFGIFFGLIFFYSLWSWYGFFFAASYVAALPYLILAAYRVINKLK